MTSPAGPRSVPGKSFDFLNFCFASSNFTCKVIPRRSVIHFDHDVIFDHDETI